MPQDLDRWIDSLDDELALGSDKFGFVPSETVCNHNESFSPAFELQRAGLNKLSKAIRKIA